MNSSGDSAIVESVCRALIAMDHGGVAAAFVRNANRHGDAVNALTGLLRVPELPELVFVLAVIGKQLARGDDSWRSDFDWLVERATAARQEVR